MLLSVVGGAVMFGGYTLVAWRNLNLDYLFISNGISGLSGGFCMFIMTTFAS
jgi:hypothetical protein